jgi:quinol-cytochrome oxidoreductase complex cytochrome b subunit
MNLKEDDKINQMQDSLHPSEAFPGLFKRIRLSVLPHPVIPKTDSDRKRFLLRNLLFHFRPATVPERTIRFSLTWGLGGMAVVLVLLQFGTGILLKFVYDPTPVAAYTSVQALIHDVPFGRLIRNVHHWCAHLLVIILVLHMLRVFFTGAFHPPRQFNWIIGLVMFCIVLLANFTGYLLPWDQLAYWAVTVSTGMLEYVPWIGYSLQKMIQGGGDIGPDTLSIFFAIHTAVMPVLMAMLMAFHFWRVRKAGGLVIPRLPKESPVKQPTRIPTVPDLILREAVVAAVLMAIVMLWSVFMNAPLANPANPGLSPNPTKAPWYFAGLQELLMHVHPMFAVCIIPSMVIIALLSIPYLKYETDIGGVWFVSRKGRLTGMIGAGTAIVLTPMLILFDEWIMDPGQRFFGVPPVIGSGLVPVVTLMAAVALFSWVLNRRFFVSKTETVQAVFILLFTAFIVLTFTGVWFRGEGMALTAPW